MNMPTLPPPTPKPTLFSQYWPLIKSLQTGLLLITGLTGYMSACCPVRSLSVLAGLSGSLFLAIAGSTMLNMWYDRDIDACMMRTSKRPLSNGSVQPGNVLRLGLLLSVVGIGWAMALSVLYGVVVLAGWFFDFVIYTLWLKRRTPWSIVWGGLAGGMPILAGRTLGLGHIDAIGLGLALAVLLWIPTHILTFAIRNDADYRKAAVPTFASHYGYGFTRWAIAISSVLASLAMIGSAYAIGVTQGGLHLMGLLSGALLFLAARAVSRPSEKATFRLFKYASVYMLLSMVLIAAIR